MRAAVRSVVVLVTVASTVLAGPPGTALAELNQARGLVIASVSPAQGEVVGIAHPVVVTFRGAVANRQAAERAIQVTSAPAMSGSFEWLDDDVVQWVPAQYWPAHSTVALSVGGLSTDFTTGPAILGVADISDHTFTVSVDGVELGVMPASMGKERFPTPLGNYSVLAKDRSVVMDSSTVGIPVDDPEGYHLTVDYAVRITGRGLYVHSAPWAVNSLGFANVSHGCISISPANAEWYFDTVNVGDPVKVQE